MLISLHKCFFKLLFDLFLLANVWCNLTINYKKKYKSSQLAYFIKKIFEQENCNAISKGKMNSRFSLLFT